MFSLLVAFCVFRILKWHKSTVSALTLFIIVFLFCSMPITSFWLHPLINYTAGSTRAHEFNDQPYDAILVAGWQQPFQLNAWQVDYFDSERLLSAAQQHAKTDKPVIVVSSQYPIPKSPQSNEQVYAIQKLIQLGVAQDSIINAPPGRTTREAMQNGYNALRSIDAKRVLLIGYENRLPRKLASLIQFYRSDTSEMGVQPRNSFAIYTHNPYMQLIRKMPPLHKLSSWLPNERTLQSSKQQLHEITGLLAYRILGWIKRKPTHIDESSTNPTSRAEL